MEGGGQTAHAKAEIRLGMSEFLVDLREMARQKKWRWKIVACGSRIEARDAFLHARQTARETYAVLLVDAEAAVSESPREHLTLRDRWRLEGIDEGAIHLMVQVMETWIIADPEMLAAFYGRGFHANSIPKTLDLETVSKAEVTTKLEQATKDTQKGRYHKIRHARHLLQRIRPDRVRSRCAHCERLFTTIGALVG